MAVSTLSGEIRVWKRKVRSSVGRMTLTWEVQRARKHGGGVEFTEQIRKQMHFFENTTQPCLQEKSPYADVPTDRGSHPESCQWFCLDPEQPTQCYLKRPLMIRYSVGAWRISHHVDQNINSLLLHISCMCISCRGGRPWVVKQDVTLSASEGNIHQLNVRLSCCEISICISDT